ncbi:hypothetical protein GW17_00018004 [Ensete ventricosum]|nr:hypothetical protein GW17_00018004 [Ensete ventricosum]
MTRMPTPSRTNYHNAPLASTRSFTQRIRRLKSDIPLDRGWGRRLVRRRGLVLSHATWIRSRAQLFVLMAVDPNPSASSAGGPDPSKPTAKDPKKKRRTRRRKIW